MLLLLPVVSFGASAEDFTNAVHAFLQQRIEIEKRDVGIVVGIVDEQGSRIVSCGKIGHGMDQEVNGDTLFEVGSITKTFTTLLLQDMIQRGKMKLEDPVAKYLPKSVRMPARNGKEITLLQLATHTSGLPTSSINWIPKRADNPRADYTIQRMYDILSNYQLTRDPGAQYEYSTLGMALLGHAIALKAGTDYETLMVNRICRPLKMASTRLTLTPKLKARCAAGYNSSGYAVPSTFWGALAPGAGVRSTANDLLKYLSANLGLRSSPLTTLMEKTHTPQFYARADTDTGLDTQIGLGWMLTRDLQGTQTIEHAGLTDGFIAFVGFDLTRRRGVVILSNCQDFDLPPIGNLLLESEWQSDRRPMQTKLSSQIYDSYAGRYQQKNLTGDSSRPMIGIRRDGDRLFIKTMGPKTWPADVLLPRVAMELSPQSKDSFFGRLSGMPITFARDAQGIVTGLTVCYQKSQAVSYEKTSAEPLQASVPPKPDVAIKVGTKFLDAVVGQYQFAPEAAWPPNGMKLAIWREGDQLVGQAWGKDVIQGAFDVYPESENSFFCPVDGARLSFTKEGEAVTKVTLQHPNGPVHEGKKVKALTKASH